MFIRFLAACAALYACSAAPAAAHAILDKTQASPGSTYRGAITITHGCEGSPTRAVRLTIPEGVVLAKAMAKPGWTITTVKGDYARAYPAYHGEVRSGAREISWTGGPALPDDQFDEFVFSGLITDAFKAGDVIRFPVIQECETGARRWVEIPAPGQSAHEVASPAPSLTIVAATDTPAPAKAEVITAGALRIEAPTIRATPHGAKVAAGYLRVTNTGTSPDTLIGGSAPLADRIEVHEMAMRDGIMSMHLLPNGLAIAPGASVELKPGSTHLMFQDLKTGAREGETIAGTLRFTRAGEVPVIFVVTGLGGPGGSGMPQHQQH